MFFPGSTVPAFDETLTTLKEIDAAKTQDLLGDVLATKLTRALDDFLTHAGEPRGKVGAVGDTSEAEVHLLNAGGVKQDVERAARFDATHEPDEARHGCL